MSCSSVHSRQLIILGAGGHASVLLSLVRAAGYSILGVCDPILANEGGRHWNGIPVLGDDSVLSGIDSNEIDLVNGIGQLVQGNARQLLFERMTAAGFHFPAVIHPAAWVAEGVKLADGVQIMAGAVVQPDCEIGANSIVNTMASIDHGCSIGAHVHIAPGATLCGGVVVGEAVFLGAGCTLIQYVRIGAKSVVGAGTVVTKDLESHSRIIAAPARFDSRGGN